MPDDEDQALAVYEALRQLGSVAQGDVGRAAGLGQDQAGAALRRLTEIGLIEAHDDGRIESVEPDTALVRTLDAYHRASADQARRAEALQEAGRALLTVYRPAVERVASRVQVEYVRERWSKHRTIDALTATIRRSADSLHPGPMPPIDVLDTSVKRDAQMIDRGVRIRAIYPQSIVQTPKYVRYLRRITDLGVSVRLIDHAPCDIMLHDDELACLPSNPASAYDNPMLLIRSTELVWTLKAIFDDFWLRAMPVEEALADGAAPGHEAELTAQERVIIRLMAGGLSDEQIARKVGVHRRTVQRAIAKLMDRLHAGSRFEAGLKLAQDPELMRVLPRNRSRTPAARVRPPGA